MDSISINLTNALCFVLVTAFAISWARNALKTGNTLPPGPPQDPIVGHLRILKPENQGDLFFSLSKVYGDVLYLRIPGRELVILNSLEAATDLLDKRSAKYSDRPNFPVLEMMGWTSSLTFLRSGKQVIKHRKLMHTYLQKDKCLSYQNFQVEEAQLLAKRLIDTPDEFDHHFLLYTTSIMLQVAYGHPVNSSDDELFKIAAAVGVAQGNSGPPGSTLVDLIPILRYFPSWFPGAYYAGAARRNKASIRKLYNYPFELVKENMRKGTVQPSFLSYHLSDTSDKNNTDAAEHIEDLKGAAATIWAAGTDTTRYTILLFTLAMLRYPEVQEKAQRELDQVIGPDRMPDFMDRQSLPYLECVLQECYRWNSVTPIGIPHRVVEDDTYKGMHIPKDAVVIANTRGIHLDERVYHNATEFNPSRYLPKPEGNAEPYPSAQFGFGRRICPGLHLADGTLWIAIAYILYSCSISRPISEDGEEIIPEVRLTSGIANHPEPFLCSIRAR